MTFLMVLWLPILLTSIVVFVLSALAWTVSPHHRGDFKTTECEDSLLKFLREAKIRPAIVTGVDVDPVGLRRRAAGAVAAAD